MIKDTKPSVAEILSKAGKGTVEENLDKLTRASPHGQISSALGDSFYGLNHRQQPGAIQINKDFYGLTFFTRPAMNLTTENLRAIRQLAPLLTSESKSIQRIIRCLLDPELGREGTGIDSPFVDNDQAFIPILTNNLLSISGWPDVIAPFHTSQEGVYKEAFSLVDGLTVNYSTYDITANFRNMPGDPITLMFFVWCHYMSLVYRGDMVPYPDFIIQNEIDYQTRIYRLVLDSTKTRVQKIGACGAAFPTNAPMGAAFNFEHDRPINASNDQISIHFQCMGAQYQDDILIYEFNRVVGLFNRGLSSEKFVDAYSRDTDGQLVTTSTNREFKKVPMDALVIFNNRGYPRINPATYELEWWVSNDDYEQRIGVYQNQQKLRNQNG